jgi:phospholipid-binding lipoprotein MlaA
VAACATPPRDDPEALKAFQEINDPLEPFNRTMFEVNMALDKAVLRPVAFVYREGVPPPLQEMVRNFLDNLQSPIILANDLLQGEFERAGTTLIRFAMNTGFGVLGIGDFAAALGLERHEEDFGQTLARWGVGSGPFLMLPLLGPTNPRDLIGRAADIFIDPLSYAVGSDAFHFSRFGTDVTDKRARAIESLDELERSSLDFYATLRSLYRQQRADQIRNGAPPPIDDLPAISFDDEILVETGNQSIARRLD